MTRLNMMLLPAGVERDLTAPEIFASPSGGEYGNQVKVELVCTDTGDSGCATIYYTTDGSEPSTGSFIYENPVTLGSGVETTLRFYAKDKAGNSSNVVTEIYKTSALGGFEPGRHAGSR